jgi:hypothetical protein
MISTRKARSWGAVLISVIALAVATLAQTSDKIKAGYSKAEHRIVMRDGVKLFTTGIRAEGHLGVLPDSTDENAI